MPVIGRAKAPARTWCWHSEVKCKPPSWRPVCKRYIPKTRPPYGPKDCTGVAPQIDLLSSAVATSTHRLSNCCATVAEFDRDIGGGCAFPCQSRRHPHSQKNSPCQTDTPWAAAPTYLRVQICTMPTSCFLCPLAWIPRS